MFSGFQLLKTLNVSLLGISSCFLCLLITGIESKITLIHNILTVVYVKSSNRHYCAHLSLENSLIINFIYNKKLVQSRSHKTTVYPQFVVNCIIINTNWFKLCNMRTIWC